MRHHNRNLILVLGCAVVTPIMCAHPAFAASASDVAPVESFLKSVIQIIASLAGIVATGFFVLGGLTYITSSGSPERLGRAKRTILWAAIGLTITIAAFVLTNTVTGLATKAFAS